MSNLRNKIIRLAKEKPELRKHLLPLVQKKASDDIIDLIEFADAWEQLDRGLKEAIKDDVFATHGGVTLTERHLSSPYVKHLGRFSRVFTNWVKDRSSELKK